MGDAQNWTVGTAIASIPIPRATGTPEPTYQLITGGPAGIDVSLPTSGADGSITGTPSAAGSGTIWIRAVNDEGSSNWTVAYTTAAALAAPGLPSTPTLSSRTTNSLTLATSPGSGGTPTLYRWRYSTNAIVSNEDPFVTSTTPSVTIPGLNAGDDYWIDVRAENSAGESGYTADLATSTAAAVIVNTDASFGARAGDPTADITPESVAVANANASLSATAGNPTVSITPESVDVLSLDDWPVPDGETAIIRALIEVGSPDIYNAANQPNGITTGALLDGDLTLATGHDLTRIREQNGDLRINNQPFTDDLGALFDTGGVYGNATWYLVTLDSEESIANSGSTLTAFNVIITWTGAISTALQGLVDGDRVILGTTIPTVVVNTDASFGANAGSPTATIEPQAVDINSDASLSMPGPESK